MLSFHLQEYETNNTPILTKEEEDIINNDIMTMLSVAGIDTSVSHMEQIEQLDHIFNTSVDNHDRVMYLNKITNQTNETCKMTMESLDQIFPNIYNSLYPPVTYTDSPSEHQIEQSIEALDLGATISIVAVAVAMTMTFYSLYKTITASPLHKNINTLDKNINKVKSIREQLEKTLKKALEEKAKPSSKLEEILMGSAKTLNIELKESNEKTKGFLKDIRLNGVLGKAFIDINDKLPEFVDTYVDTFTDFEETYASYVDNRKPISEISSKLSNIDTKLSMSLVDDINNILDTSNSYSQDSLGSFLNTVYNTKEHYELYSEDDDNLFDEGLKIMPTSVDVMDSKLKSLKSSADRYKEIEERAKANKDNPKDMPVVEQDAKVNSQFKDINKKIVDINKALSNYRKLNEASLSFYHKTAVLKTDMMRIKQKMFDAL